MFWKVLFWDALSKTLSIFAIHPTWYLSNLSMRFRWWHVGAEVVGYMSKLIGFAQVFTDVGEDQQQNVTH